MRANRRALVCAPIARRSRSPPSRGPLPHVQAFIQQLSPAQVVVCMVCMHCILCVLGDWQELVCMCADEGRGTFLVGSESHVQMVTLSLYIYIDR